MRKYILFFIIMLTGSVLIFGCTTTSVAPTTTTTPGSTTTTTAGGSGPTAKPDSTVRLCFIHHSSGGNWLVNSSDDPTVGGDLGLNLNANNYYATETDYDWEAQPGDALGYNTDLGFWTAWFNTAKMPYVYANNSHYYYTNTISDPGGENQIVIFKSCFPNSNLYGNPTDAAATGATNPIEGQNAGIGAGQSADYTVANAKWVYNTLLAYFATKTNKLFVVVTAPPLTSGNYAGSNAANARAFNNWLVSDWLSGYSHNNVVVFDFFNVLTGADNHHRWSVSAVQHYTAPGSSNAAYYPTASDGSDDHPNSSGNQKATAEFVPLLNYYYNRWQGLI
ncbi:MAG: hypothetical protein ABID35_05000 [Candidatus Margulisiibacteriota bacterium]